MISVITPSIRPEGLKIVQDCLRQQTFQDFEWLVEIGIPPKHDLNASFNRMINRAKGDLLVFYQDFIKIQDDGLELFWNEYQKDKNTCFTAPVGKVDDFADETARWDWRNYTEECSWTSCELDWGAIPLHVLKAIGGFDERLDAWWSMDNVSVGKRADILGYKFKNVINNKSVALDHDKKEQHPFRERYNPPEVNKILNEYELHPKLDFVV